MLKKIDVVMHMKFDKYWDPRRRRMQSLIVAETSKDIEFNFALVIATFMD
jgi:hypothetical protein